MDTSNLPQHQKIGIRDLYPDLDDKQLMEAEENLNRYLELAVRMYDRSIPRWWSTCTRRSTTERSAPVVIRSPPSYVCTDGPADKQVAMYFLR
jgi:hypothetical protein